LRVTRAWDNNDDTCCGRTGCRVSIGTLNPTCFRFPNRILNLDSVRVSNEDPEDPIPWGFLLIFSPHSLRN
jgi:hypothetical protein